MNEAEPTSTEPGSAAWWTAYGERLGRRRPRVGGLTVEQILGEAIDLLDAEGLEGLTVRALTGRLGTSSASLYRHVASVEELLVLVVDRVLGEVNLPDPSLPARQRVVDLALEFRTVLRRHPGAVPALRAAPLLGPNALRGAQSGLSGLLDCGLDAPKAMAAWISLIDYVFGSVFFDTASIGARARESDVHLFELETDVLGGNTDRLDGDVVFAVAVDAFLDGFGA